MAKGKWFDVAFVVWRDSSSLDPPNVWREKARAEALEPAKVLACGFVIAESSSHITIASHIGEDDEPGKEEVAGELCIPKVAVVQEKRWRVFRKDGDRK